MPTGSTSVARSGTTSASGTASTSPRRRWRLEGRAALDEVLKRFPDWDVDWDGAKMAYADRAWLGPLAVVTG